MSFFDKKKAPEAPKNDRSKLRNVLVVAGAQTITPFWDQVEAEVDRLEQASRPKVEKRLTKG